MTLPLKLAELERNRLYTADEFMAAGLDPDQKYELVEGVVKAMSHPGLEHGLITSRLSKALWKWIFSFGEAEPGQVVPPIGYKLDIPGASRESVRSPDLTFVRKQQLENNLSPGAAKFPPDLAIEVISSQDEPGDLVTKLEQYSRTGWNIVWVIYPGNAPAKKDYNTVRIYHLQESLTPVKILTLTNNDQLEGEGPLIGFTLNLSELFSLAAG